MQIYLIFQLIFESQFNEDTTTGHIFLDELSVIYEPCVEKETEKQNCF